MKKTNKLFSIFFIGLFVFLGINFTENTKSTKNLDNQPQTKKQVKSKKNTIYFLQPDEAFNPNDFAFDEYWNQTKIIENNNPNEKLGEELFVIKAIEETEDGFYKIDLYYTQNTTINSPYESWTPKLNVTNNDDFNKTYVFNSFGAGQNDWTHPFLYEIKIPQKAIKEDGILNLKMTLDFSGYKVKVETSESILPHFNIYEYPYLNGFFINDFSIDQKSLKGKSFEFLIQITLPNGEIFKPEDNNLTLYSNKNSLKTTYLAKDSVNYLHYKVSGLKQGQTYNNFYIQITDYKYLKFVDTDLSVNIPTKTSAGTIVGAVFGSLLGILLIIIVILFIWKNRDKIQEFFKIEKQTNTVNEHRVFHNAKKILIGQKQTPLIASGQETSPQPQKKLKFVSTKNQTETSEEQLPVYQEYNDDVISFNLPVNEETNYDYHADQINVEPDRGNTNYNEQEIYEDEVIFEQNNFEDDTVYSPEIFNTEEEETTSILERENNGYYNYEESENLQTNSFDNEYLGEETFEYEHDNEYLSYPNHSNEEYLESYEDGQNEETRIDEYEANQQIQPYNEKDYWN